MSANKILSIDNITKNFGGLCALDNVSFSISEGGILGLVGPNGSGKTTLFGVISGLYHSDGGRITFNGERINGLGPHHICKKGIGRTFQTIQSFPSFSVYEAVLVAALGRNNMRTARRLTREILELVGLADKAERLSEGITFAQQRTLQVARALATEPKLLLLDEVMSGLLPSEIKQSVNLIARLNQQGLAFIIVEHIMEPIGELCEQVVVLDFGQKIAEGPPNEVWKDSKVIEAYLGKSANEST